jgi:hypothetical protein
MRLLMLQLHRAALLCASGTAAVTIAVAVSAGYVTR